MLQVHLQFKIKNALKKKLKKNKLKFKIKNTLFLFCSHKANSEIILTKNGKI